MLNKVLHCSLLPVWNQKSLVSYFNLPTLWNVIMCNERKILRYCRCILNGNNRSIVVIRAQTAMFISGPNLRVFLAKHYHTVTVWRRSRMCFGHVILGKVIYFYKLGDVENLFSHWGMRMFSFHNHLYQMPSFFSLHKQSSRLFYIICILHKIKCYFNQLQKEKH